MTTVPTYLNPVHPRPCPDPFVLKHAGEYWCYGTGFWFDGRCFGVLHSDDLLRWQELPGAMAPLPAGHPEYWAPEVTFCNGRFYMYYSCGDGVLMEIRVAVSERPAGPFEDAGKRLSPQDFAIDAHVFQDEDGTRYMFYATDFLEHSRVGTGTVIDRMIDPFTLAGNPRPVSRARFDWQVYDPHRLEKGGVRWHTVEGPFVLKRKGRYYQMYSGGNWQNTSYGVSYAATTRIDTLQEWTQLEHDDRKPLVLRTLPGQVIGPGHNSVVRGPDNMQLFCIYHRWDVDGSGRLLSIDRLEWIGDRIAVLGPSTTPQPVPLRPAFRGFSSRWRWDTGNWVPEGHLAVRQDGHAPAEASIAVPSSAFVVEVTIRLDVPENEDDDSAEHAAGLSLYDGEVLRHSFRLATSPQRAEVAAGASEWTRLDTPVDFDAGTWHLLRLEVAGSSVTVLLDGLVRWHGSTAGTISGIRLFTHAAVACFAGFALTVGWNDLFTDSGSGLPPGWRVFPSSGDEDGSDWSVADGALTCAGRGSSLLVKEHLFEQYELVVNARLLEFGRDAMLGFIPDLAHGTGHCFSLELSAGVPCVCVRNFREIDRLGEDMPLHRFPLPAAVDWTEYQQFRFRRTQGRITFQLESQEFGEIETAGTHGTHVALFARGAPGAFDMVRLTSTEPDERGE